MAQRAASSGSRGSLAAPPIVHDVVNSPGQSLDASTRAFFESRFGHDFSRVQVHTDERAIQSARDIHARAYTVGHNIVFGAGQSSPATQDGRRLLAHELTHVVQQSGRTDLDSGRRKELGGGFSRGCACQPRMAISYSSTCRQDGDSLPEVSQARDMVPRFREIAGTSSGTPVLP